MTNNTHSRRRVLQATGIAVGSSVVIGTASADDYEVPESYSVDLTGDAETHEVETNASGVATFEADLEAREIHYTIDVEWLCHATQAHIHSGSKGEDGPVVAQLYPEDGSESKLIEGRFDGTLAEGTLTADDFVGEFAGTDFEAIARKLAEEGAYVNVHTKTYPEGELRGQIVPGEAPPTPDDPEEEEEEEPEEEEADEEDEEPGDDEEEEEEEPEDEEEADEEDEPDEEEADASEALQVAEVNVLGNDPADENIVFENTSDQDLDLTGFEVWDAEGGAVEDRNTPEGPYVFGDFVLEAGATVTLHSGEGTADGENVYWGQTGLQVWNQDGDTIRVFNPDGDLVLEHTYGDQTSSIRGIFSTVRTLFA